MKMKDEKAVLEKEQVQYFTSVDVYQESSWEKGILASVQIGASNLMYIP